MTKEFTSATGAAFGSPNVVDPSPIPEGYATAVPLPADAVAIAAPPAVALTVNEADPGVFTKYSVPATRAVGSPDPLKNTGVFAGGTAPTQETTPGDAWVIVTA